MRNRHVLRSVTLLTAVALSAGCASDPQEAPWPVAPAPEPDIQYSQVWSADPGVDLFSRGAELVRASLEAGQYSSVFGMEYSYPGYRDAVGGPRDYGDPNVDENLTRLDPDDHQPAGSTFFRHITEYTASDTTVGATVCAYALSATPIFNATLRFNEAWRVELTNAADNPGLAGIEDTDPDHQDSAHRRPDWDVFGTWKIETLHLVGQLGGTETPPGCLVWWHEQFPAFEYGPDGDTLRPPAGFVAPTMPVAVQYPEWIGPTSVG